MSDWVPLCAQSEAPAAGEVAEFEARGVAVCLANIDGEMHALDNWCPHRRGPLGQGWVDGKTVVCPWHAWAFDVRTGMVCEPEVGKVSVFPVKLEDGSVLVDIE